MNLHMNIYLAICCTNHVTEKSKQAMTSIEDKLSDQVTKCSATKFKILGRPKSEAELVKVIFGSTAVHDKILLVTNIAINFPVHHWILAIPDYL